ncbi:rhodanese-like domain-containing protein [Saccharomonospora glauca]|uniref:Rhodanese-related sulfurtransferase n=1 Tax=Saccharomonospora glauca K62 TaxID=928724 RepID=I1D0A9_9PSEU|nr:rhodanese-like domain-containing protein [Saccharomonospora glauca]EIE98383.1 Rhodanese-related sulfurtransferase [Saccharomonospora glauca K62]
MDKTVIDAPTLKQRIAEGDELTIIDVRTPAEFRSTHIPGSHNIPLQLLSENTRDLAERLGGNVVLVCQSGARAAQAQQRLTAVGFDNADVLTGGVSAFESAGGDVVRSARRWAMERQVRMAAGSLVLLGFLGSRLIDPRLGYLSAAIGGGLTFSALTNSCGMAAVLAKMPWNRTAANPTLEEAVCNLPTALRKD